MHMCVHISLHLSIHKSIHKSIHISTHPSNHLHDITEVHSEERAADALHWMDLVEDQAATSLGDAPHALIGTHMHGHWSLCVQLLHQGCSLVCAVTGPGLSEGDVALPHLSERTRPPSQLLWGESYWWHTASNTPLHQQTKTQINLPKLLKHHLKQKIPLLTSAVNYIWILILDQITFIWEPQLL